MAEQSLEELKGAAKTAADAAEAAAAEAASKVMLAREAQSAYDAAKEAAVTAEARAADDPTNADAGASAADAKSDAAAKGATLEAAKAAANAAGETAAAAAKKARAAQDAVDRASSQGSGSKDSTGSPSPASVPPATYASYLDLLKAVLTDPNISGEDKRQLVSQLKGISPTSDRLTYRTAIYLLGLIAVIALGALWHVAIAHPDMIPQGLVAIASGAVGGLAGLLSPSKSPDPHST
jgi:hypothetical protein